MRGEVQRSLATVVIGEVVSKKLLTLMIADALYDVQAQREGGSRVGADLLQRSGQLQLI
jgi:Cu/Ag efflux pump CusA